MEVVIRDHRRFARGKSNRSRVLEVADFEQIVDIANDIMATWTPQQKTKDDVHISHVELRLSSLDVDNLNISSHSKDAAYYQDFSEEERRVGKSVDQV